MSIQQLAFDFTFRFIPAKSAKIDLPRTVVRLARRYRLPATHAAIYAVEMRMAGGEEI